MLIILRRLYLVESSVSLVLPHRGYGWGFIHQTPTGGIFQKFISFILNTDGQYYSYQAETIGMCLSCLISQCYWTYGSSYFIMIVLYRDYFHLTQIDILNIS